MSYGSVRPARPTAAAWCGAALLGLTLFANAAAEPVAGGGYSFSDELGGFAIGQVRGSGSAADPIVIEQRLTETVPVTMVIRRLPPAPAANPYIQTVNWVAVHIRLMVTNASNRVWEGFEVELQEILNEPSPRDDGLSFDQAATMPTAVISNLFASNHRLFEPHDRIRFMQGHVDPDGTVGLQMLITDPTPAAIFYLVMEPTLLSS